MTTIVFDKTGVASDEMCTRGDFIVRQDAAKVVVRGGLIFAIAGLYCAFEPAVEWILSGAAAGGQPSAPAGHSWALVVASCLDHQARTVVLDEYTSDCPYAERLPLPWAMGAGRDFALGAIWAGADAKRAIRLVAEHTLCAGGQLNYLTYAQAFEWS